MNSTRVLLVSIGLILSAQLGVAQDLSRYRAYVLASNLDSVISATGLGPADARTLHERPAKIQELEWRAPLLGSGGDPVGSVAFAFYDDALYQVVVSYDRNRTDGLTSGDIIESLTAAYGEPVVRSARRRPAAAPSYTVVLAQWDSTASSLTLLRDTYSPDFQLMLISKPLSTRARAAIREATRLEAIEAPRRELEQRKQEAADADEARDKTRATNKAVFRP